MWIVRGSGWPARVCRVIIENSLDGMLARWPSMWIVRESGWPARVCRVIVEHSLDRMLARSGLAHVGVVIFRDHEGKHFICTYVTIGNIALFHILRAFQLWRASGLGWGVWWMVVACGGLCCCCGGGLGED